MKIEIGLPVPTPIDKYVFELQAMHGDADDFTELEYTASDLDDAKRVAEELVSFKQHERDRKWYNEVFLIEEEDDLEYYDHWWPCDDPEYNQELPADLWTWVLYYYDSNGVKHYTDKKAYK